LDPGIEATACACEILYVYIILKIIITFVLALASLWRHAMQRSFRDTVLVLADCTMMTVMVSMYEPATELLWWFHSSAAAQLSRIFYRLSECIRFMLCICFRLLWAFPKYIVVEKCPHFSSFTANFVVLVMMLFVSVTLHLGLGLGLVLVWIRVAWYPVLYSAYCSYNAGDRLLLKNVTKLFRQALKFLWRKKLTILLSRPLVSQTAVWFLYSVLNFWKSNINCKALPNLNLSHCKHRNIDRTLQ